MLGIANVVFIMYDICLDSCHHIYVKKLAPKFRKKR